MRCYALLVSMVALVALVGCQSKPIPPNQSETPPPVAAPSQAPQAASAESAREYLLTSAAADFRKHPVAPSVQFRNVRFGGAATPDGEKQYMLCGELLPNRAARKSDWIPFVTIKTSGFEQYLGDQAASFCKKPSISWNGGDLSSTLQSRFDSM